MLFFLEGGGWKENISKDLYITDVIDIHVWKYSNTYTYVEDGSLIVCSYLQVPTPL